MSRSVALAPSARPCCAFCPRVAVDAIDVDDERGVPVCAACGGLRVGRRLATRSAHTLVTPASALPYPPPRKAPPVRKTRAWRPGTGEPFDIYRPLGGRGRR